MSSRRYAAPLHLDLRPSRRCAVLVPLIHGAAAVMPFLADMPGWLRPALAAAVLLQGWRTWRIHVRRRGGDAIRRAVWRRDGLWELYDAAGRRRLAGPALAVYEQRALVAILLRRMDGRRARLVLLPDMLDSGVWRRLRVRLRRDRGAFKDAGRSE